MNSSPFSKEHWAGIAAKSSSRAPRSKSSVSISSLPASIFERSRMSFRSASSDSPLARTLVA